MGLAVDVAGQVLGRPAQLDEHLLEVAALRGVDDDVGLSEPGPQQALGALGAHDLLQDRHVGGVQDQAVGGVGEELEAPVAAHRLGDLGEQGVRHREARVGDEGVDDRLRVQARGARVPQGQRRDPVGVDVLRGALQLGEGGDGAAGLTGPGVGDLQEDGLVGLDDERAVGGRRRRGRRVAGRSGHGREYPKSGRRGAVTEETFLFQREALQGARNGDIRGLVSKSVTKARDGLHPAKENRMILRFALQASGAVGSLCHRCGHRRPLRGPGRSPSIG